jgi:8-oxo-dGTP pyrophosphatase MutT (NUDIX family)
VLFFEKKKLILKILLYSTMETTCGVYIIDSNDRLLICHPTSEDLNKWSIPKGLAKNHEKFEDTAIREVEEETGIDLMAFEGHLIYIGEEFYRNKPKKLIGFYFKLQSEIILDIKCSSLIGGSSFPENDMFKWVALNEAYLYIQPEQNVLLNKLINKQNEI